MRGQTATPPQGRQQEKAHALEAAAQEAVRRPRQPPSTSPGNRLSSVVEVGTIAKTFTDRRQVVGGVVRGVADRMEERRQFPTPKDPEAVSPDAKELQWAIDVYKMEHGLKRISVTELLGVLERLGYHRD